MHVLQLSLGGGLRVGSSGDGAASGGTAIMLRLLGGRPGPQHQPSQGHQHPASHGHSGDHAATAAAAALTPSSSVSRVSGGSNLSRLSGGSVAAAHQQQAQQQYGLPRHGSGGRAGDASSGQSMQQIVALLEQMAADDRAAAERPWRSMDLPALGRGPAHPLSGQRRGCAANPSLDLGRTPVRSAAPHPPTLNTLPLSSVLPGRLLPPMRSSFAMAPPRRS